LFTVGKVLIGYYLGNAAIGSAYGAAGSLVIVLLWTYYSAQILLFGAELTQAYARMKGAGIVPSAHARRASPEPVKAAGPLPGGHARPA
jgi:membrane protein